MKRWIIVIGLCIATGLALTGCDKKSGDGSGTSGATYTCAYCKQQFTGDPYYTFECADLGPQKVGGQWTPNLEVLRKQLAKDKAEVKPEDVTGKMTLAKISEVDGQKCLHLVGRIAIKNFKAASPANVELVSASVAIEIAADFPVDPALPSLRESAGFVMSMVMNLTPPNSVQPVRVEAKETRKVKRIFTLMPKAGAVK